MRDPRKDPAVWIPVRFVSREQECQFCWEKIPRAHPGRSTGTRGTKAWFNPALDAWECLTCRSLATDADLARQELEAKARGERQAS